MDSLNKKIPFIHSLDIYTDYHRANRKLLPQLTKTKYKPALLPLHCFDIIAMEYSYLKQKHADQSHLSELKQKYSWELEIESLLKNPYDALVLTDIQRKIMWVDLGFEIMTGYTFSEVMGKRPSILQGKETKKAKIEIFKKKLNNMEKFEIELTNYRKSGIPYQCLVQILPLKNHKHQITHFLAIEKQVS